MGVLNLTPFTQHFRIQEISTMKTIVLSLMLCVGICSSSPARSLHKRQTCNLSGFSDYRIRFRNTGFRACVWDFFACKRTEKSSDYNELDTEESSDYSGLDVRGDSLSESCCRQRFDACYNVIKKPKKTTSTLFKKTTPSPKTTPKPYGNDAQDSEDYSDYDTRGDELDSRSDSLLTP